MSECFRRGRAARLDAGLLSVGKAAVAGDEDRGVPYPPPILRIVRREGSPLLERPSGAGEPGTEVGAVANPDAVYVLLPDAKLVVENVPRPPYGLLVARLRPS